MCLPLSCSLEPILCSDSAFLVMIFFICCAVLVLAAVAASVWVGIKRK